LKAEMCGLYFNSLMIMCCQNYYWSGVQKFFMIMTVERLKIIKYIKDLRYIKDLTLHRQAY